MQEADRNGIFRVCLVVPCYNEAKRLNVEAFREFLRATEDIDLIFVDDGSSDSTRAVVAQIQHGFEHRAKIISYPNNRGKAEAVRAGCLHVLSDSSYQAFGFWDADLSTPLDAVSRLARILEDQTHVDLVFGSRVKLCGRHIKRRPLRHYAGRIFATVVSTMLNLAIYDTQCGAKLFRNNGGMESVFAQPFLSQWVFDVEILARLLRDFSPSEVETKIYEYPLEVWEDISGSKVRPKDFFLAMIDVMKIKGTYL